MGMGGNGNRDVWENGNEALNWEWDGKVMIPREWEQQVIPAHLYCVCAVLAVEATLIE